MKNRVLIFVLLAVITAFIPAVPATASANTGLYVNGEKYDSAYIFQDNGLSFIALESFKHFTGADIEWPDDQSFIINENGKKLYMSLGKTAGLLDGKALELPAAPVRMEKDVFVPLRFICMAFGYTVSWNEEMQAVNLERTAEKVDGLTARELLDKSNKVMGKFKTYSISGAFNMNTDMASEGEKTGPQPIRATIKMNSQVSNNPAQTYIKETIRPLDNEQFESTEIEIYIDEKNMYIKPEGKGWTKTEMPRAKQDIVSDPVTTMARMQDIGMLLNYGNDVSIGNKEYYVLNCTMDMNEVKNYVQNMFGSLVNSLPDAVGQTLTENIINKLMQKMSVDYYISLYIEKEKLVCDMMDVDMKINLFLNLADLLGSMEISPDVEGEKMPEITISLDLTGKYNICETKKPFAAPDVSKVS